MTQHITSYTSAPPESIPHVDFEQFATGGLKGTAENRALDWQERKAGDWLFGELVAKARLTGLGGVGDWRQEGEGEGEGGIGEDRRWLIEGWGDEYMEGGDKQKGEEVVESYVENKDKGWTGWQVWGFKELEVCVEFQFPPPLPSFCALGCAC